MQGRVYRSWRHWRRQDFPSGRAKRSYLFLPCPPSLPCPPQPSPSPWKWGPGVLPRKMFEILLCWRWILVHFLSHKLALWLGVSSCDTIENSFYSTLIWHQQRQVVAFLAKIVARLFAESDFLTKFAPKCPDSLLELILMNNSRKQCCLDICKLEKLNNVS